MERELIDASRDGKLKKVIELCRKKVNIHAEEDKSLRLAAFYGHFKIVKFLLRNGANVNAKNDDALCSVSSSSGRIDIIRILLEYGANVNANDNKSLRLASLYGHDKAVKILLDYGADLHIEDDRPLQLASFHNHLECVKILLDYGSDIAKLYSNSSSEMKMYIPINPRRIQCISR